MKNITINQLCWGMLGILLSFSPSETLQAKTQAIPPALLSPQDEAVLTHVNPRFAWSAPVPKPGDGTLKYRLKIVRVESYQTAKEAIQLNLAHFEQSNLSSESLTYAINGMPFDKALTYAWMVEAISNGKLYGRSKVWTFSFAQPNQKDTLKIPEVYTIPKATPDASIYQAKEVIGFKFDRCESCALPTVQVLGQNQKPVKLRGITLEPAKANLLNLQLPKGCGLKPGQLYTLVISEGDKPNRIIIFSYHHHDEK
ncbi:MAG: hypothetical protein AB8F95_17355 [Bacteroidia bacterium]